jgi:hypothetical protein
VYKQKVKAEIERMLEAEIIEPMVVKDNKIGEFKICVDLRKLNDVCLYDPFSNSFINEVLENVGGQEAYSFTDGFSGYH